MDNILEAYDYVIVGSGFGGSVSALRLSEKGYSVLIIEKGKWFNSEDFPKTNWNLKNWLWEPRLRFFGFFKMTYLRHVTILSGVGVGGGSLTYANTLPVPSKEFFYSGSWANLDDWEESLKPHYEQAHRMLGASSNPSLAPADIALKELAEDLGKSSHFSSAKVGVYFGEPGKTVSDPYFGGEGPDRTGCIKCGACMTGCRHNAKNTLDKNYLYLAQKYGATIIAEHEVFDILPVDKDRGSSGYEVHFKSSIGKTNHRKVIARNIVFSGGVMGTIPLLLQLKAKNSLPHLSEMLGCNIRTNNESLLGLCSTMEGADKFSEGIAIGSILELDENSHVEPVRYGKGSSFFRLLSIPSFYNNNVIVRLLGVLAVILKQPIIFLKTIFRRKYSESTIILLFMQTLDSTLRFNLKRNNKIKTSLESGAVPSGFIPSASTLAKKLGKKIKAMPFANFTDVLLGTPTTAHVLGGAVMAEDKQNGVIDKDNKVFGYDNMLICDGSMISANPGVNPSLSITAITEYAMSKIPEKANIEP